MNSKKNTSSKIKKIMNSSNNSSSIITLSKISSSKAMPKDKNCKHRSPHSKVNFCLIQPKTKIYNANLAKCNKIITKISPLKFTLINFSIQFILIHLWIKSKSQVHLPVPQKPLNNSSILHKSPLFSKQCQDSIVLSINHPTLNKQKDV